MQKLITNIEFVNKLKHIESNVNTIYVLGGIGQTITDSLIESLCDRHPLNYVREFNSKRREMYKEHIGDYAFDCIGVIKAIAWDWTEEDFHYAINGVPDQGADATIYHCTDKSTDFDNIMVGEVVHLPGHIGVYIGNGDVIECTPAWNNDVQITKLTDRDWVKHGKLPWVKYVTTRFTDVDDTAWYADAVDYVSQRGIMIGKENNLFYPDSALTRAEMAVICKRILERS